MLSQITIAGRTTKDPIMQTKGDSQYITLDIAQTQGFGETEHKVFFSCYFSSYLAERLLKAKVGKGTCLDIVGRFDSKEFTRKDGTLGRSLEIRVYDWDFSISNRNDGVQNGAPNMAPGTQAPPNPPAGQIPPSGMGQNPGFTPGAAPPAGNNMQPANNNYMTPPAGQTYAPPMQGSPAPQQSADGFTGVPQAYAGQLPFPG